MHHFSRLHFPVRLSLSRSFFPLSFFLLYSFFVPSRFSNVFLPSFPFHPSSFSFFFSPNFFLPPFPSYILSQFLPSVILPSFLFLSLLPSFNNLSFLLPSLIHPFNFRLPFLLFHPSLHPFFVAFSPHLNRVNLSIYSLLSHCLPPSTRRAAMCTNKEPHTKTTAAPILKIIAIQH